MTKTLIDSNILIYAHQKKDEEKCVLSAKIVNHLIDNGDIVLSVQNLVEFSRVLSEKSVPLIDNDLIRQYVFDLIEVSSIIEYNSNTVMNALSISKQYSIHFFDALLVATMQENGISKIITENEKDFEKMSWLEVINPFKENK
ncbi:MAG: PIN domain-containing protein [Candidatus Micrarchaeia archaeon]